MPLSGRGSAGCGGCVCLESLVDPVIPLSCSCHGAVNVSGTCQTKSKGVKPKRCVNIYQVGIRYYTAPPQKCQPYLALRRILHPLAPLDFKPT